MTLSDCHYQDKITWLSSVALIANGPPSNVQNHTLRATTTKKSFAFSHQLHNFSKEGIRNDTVCRINNKIHHSIPQSLLANLVPHVLLASIRGKISLPDPIILPGFVLSQTKLPGRLSMFV